MAEVYSKIELSEFGSTKAGVKGLMDAGMTKIPQFLVDTTNDNPDSKPSDGSSKLCLPVIDMKGIDGDATTRGEIVFKVKEACEQWGMFQIVNHGLPERIMNEMIEGVRKFQDLDIDEKKQYYSDDITKPFQYTNFLSFTEPAALWRDSTLCVMAPNPPNPHEIPDVLRDVMFDYAKNVHKVSHKLCKLMSEALGLNSNYLRDIGCDESIQIVAHYYPVCPEPELTFGSMAHADLSPIAILLQDQTGGLQVWNQNQWINVPPVDGGLVVNVGEFMQLITNDKFPGALHRAVVNNASLRISVVTFVKPYCPDGDNHRIYGPIKELITEEEPPIYKETTFKDFENFCLSKIGNGGPKVQHFKLANSDRGDAKETV